LNEEYILAGHDISIKASIGISMYPDDSEEIDTLFRNADSALYCVKKAGKNTFAYYGVSKDLNICSPAKLHES
jgi:diguanylate cyclase (GGDEF)-like protein